MLQYLIIDEKMALVYMRNILTGLLEGSDREIRQNALRHYDALERQLNYLNSIQNEHLLRLYRSGWKRKKIMCLLAFQAFYQAIVGPLVCSTRTNERLGLGGRIPIMHGTTKYDSERNRAVRTMHRDFQNLIGELEFRENWLNQRLVSDLVYKIAQDIQRDSDE